MQIISRWSSISALPTPTPVEAHKAGATGFSFEIERETGRIKISQTSCALSSGREQAAQGQCMWVFLKKVSRTNDNAQATFRQPGGWCPLEAIEASESPGKKPHVRAPAGGSARRSRWRLRGVTKRRSGSNRVVYRMERISKPARFAEADRFGAYFIV